MAAKSFCATWLEMKSQLLLSAWPQGSPSPWESLWPLLQPPVNKQGDKPSVVEYILDVRLNVQKDLVESSRVCPGGLWGKGSQGCPCSPCWLLPGHGWLVFQLVFGCAIFDGLMM